ncbi:MAG: sigma-70 family RNA polymerase sigma factor [Fimbriimonadales bacterium]|jgi:RNA polymerase sigma-70 factor (ECF subfamily)|nr:sigma-70 family RNA polymerase sigma factor [Fimbriimonadales bacterium]GIV14128.1 MAG: RNA polymerase sigma factor [Fimbriimonadales bacterium]CUU11225.1 RNA polymerase sigma-70 factor, ECF subfamily [Armatimonadetes bacterium GBS]
MLGGYELSDERLIERFKEGDDLAFDMLVRRYEQKVYQYAYRLTRNPDDAADVVAETFLRMYNALKRFRGDAQLSTWLYRIVSNVFFDFRKREQRHEHLPLEIQSEDDDEPMERPIPDENIDLEAHVLEQERKRVLMEAIQKLPDYQRMVLILFHIEERPYEEIAQITGLPLGTIKSRLNRARNALRELLEPHRELFGYSTRQIGEDLEEASDAV